MGRRLMRLDSMASLEVMVRLEERRKLAMVQPFILRLVC
jgi:hypothetical protein